MEVKEEGKERKKNKVLLTLELACTRLPLFDNCYCDGSDYP